MKKDFKFELFGESINAEAELFRDEEIRLKTVITVFKCDGQVDFRGSIYINPSRPEFELLMLRSDQDLLDEGVERFISQFDFNRHVPTARKSGINVIINWLD